MKRVYLDYAATTPLDPEVAEAMARVLRDVSGNPSSVYEEGRAARALVDQARDDIAAALGAQASEIVFTSGGTEADNLALRGVMRARRLDGDGLVTSAIEHHAVLDTASDLVAEGRARLTVVAVDRWGRVNPDSIRDSLDDRTVLVSVMHANNEIGTVQPIAEIAAICKERAVTFHTDAVQTIGAIGLDVRRVPVDLVSLSAHKIHGPKGIGALYLRRGTRLSTQQTGGGQERGRRTGTENVAGIVGFGMAARKTMERARTETGRQVGLRDRLIAGVLGAVPGAILTGHQTDRLPNNASFCISGVPGEALVLTLDLEGFSVSSGSACTSGNTDPSHVILALGIDPAIARSSLRLTVGRDTTEMDVDRLIEALPPIVARCRDLFPEAVAS